MEKTTVAAVYISARYNFGIDAKGDIVPQKNLRHRYQCWEEHDGHELTEDEKKFLFAYGEREYPRTLTPDERKKYGNAYQLYYKRIDPPVNLNYNVYDGVSVLQGIPTQCADAKGPYRIQSYSFKHHQYDKKTGAFRLECRKLRHELPMINGVVAAIISKTEILKMLNIKTAEEALTSNVLTTILFMIFKNSITGAKLDETPAEKLVDMFFEHHGAINYDGNIREAIH